MTDAFAQDREVILFDNAGISSSSGEVPTSIEEMAADAAAFVNALGLIEVDVLGFSIGGFVAQGDHLSGARPREAPGLGRNWPAQRRGQGYAHASGAGNLRRHL